MLLLLDKQTNMEATHTHTHTKFPQWLHQVFLFLLVCYFCISECFVDAAAAAVGEAKAMGMMMMKAAGGWRISLSETF